jgi:hypothetical protein
MDARDVPDRVLVPIAQNVFNMGTQNRRKRMRQEIE